eukprot:CAMPEP_0196594608 /NCGR_PEP_ID=MMETSP1081-20130531/78799_1 /TAXON_ID=36882 /ORGANISM="Pyramimonas amylifera, Strain CCMP720" /LENGTH=125 /DNA_ID=CAMNT_0041918913 /DNA_START=252 /DNA_END=626 /DNA_ORIENTATION=-
MSYQPSMDATMHGGGKERGRWRGQAVIALNDDFRASDVLTALLQVAHMRNLPFRKDMSVDQARVWAAQESRARAHRDFEHFCDDLKIEGWQCKEVLLSSAEKVTFHAEGGLDNLAKTLGIGESKR